MDSPDGMRHWSGRGSVTAFPVAPEASQDPQERLLLDMGRLDADIGVPDESRPPHIITEDLDGLALHPPEVGFAESGMVSEKRDTQGDG